MAGQSVSPGHPGQIQRRLVYRRICHFPIDFPGDDRYKSLNSHDSESIKN